MSGFTVREFARDLGKQQPVTLPSIAIASHLEEGRRELQLAKEIAQQSQEGEMYVWLSSRIGEIDAMRSVLAEREDS